MTCRHLGTSLNDGNFEPPRKRALGTLLIALALALSVVALGAAVSITPPLVGEALAFGDDGGGGEGEGGGEDGGSGDGDGGSSSSNDPPPGFSPKPELVPWLAGDWSRDGSGEKRTRDVVSKIKSIDRQKRPVYRSGRAAPGSPPVTGRDRYGVAAPATTGQPAPFIGITEGAFTLECAACISWGPPDQLPSVPQQQVKNRITRVITYRQVLSLLSPEMLALIRDILEMVVAALGGVPPGVTTSLSIHALGQLFIQVEIEVAGRKAGFMVSIQEALQAYQEARARGVTVEAAAIAGLAEAAAKAGLDITPENMEAILGRHGADMLARAARSLTPGDQASR